ncbi:MAG: DUF3192 domain-containing protein [Gammaproteobacteria bacterium]|nr:DUF3192 domain-containing protein [Gammaproteobacteria bacterium]MBU1478275.1 DUF3192 domain-containing protein [Gammaproteobacteria bacterium]MBU2002804.1 DUF3192 domain-containing protein [Gammaproteobacteria bacterium]MBU2131527.1 DUF3192 domain-containing protein [Gammaproteobacteria bacterium]MBU2185730.1 DUF3192 domain-containing protein [Gammaproteobacteria bacterium]
MINHKLNNKLIAITFLGLASLGLSGCVVNVGDSESGWDSSESWEKVQDKNRTNLTKLSLGMPKDQVMILMGTADFSEAYIQQSAQQGGSNKEVLVLFYRTQRNNGDGKTTKDECTPIVLSNNALVGWGETAYSKI